MNYTDDEITLGNRLNKAVENGATLPEIHKIIATSDFRTQEKLNLMMGILDPSKTRLRDEPFSKTSSDFERAVNMELGQNCFAIRARVNDLEMSNELSNRMEQKDLDMGRQNDLVETGPLTINELLTAQIGE